MRSMLDSTFDDAQGLDIFRGFEYLCLEAGASDASNEVSETECDSIWLECDSELVDAASVKVIGTREFPGGFETLVFICPHCNEPHESLRFR